MRVTDACGSMVDWTSFRLGVTRRTAHEWVDAARRLAEFPRIAAAFSDGRLSWDKTKAVATVAEELLGRPASSRDPGVEAGDTEEPRPGAAAETLPGSLRAGKIDEDALIEEALATDAGRLESSARRARKVSLLDVQRRERQRSVSLRRCRDDGGLRLSGFLPDADGEAVAKAIETIAGRAEKNPDTGLYASYDRRCADALVEMASDALSRAQAERGDRAMVVAHVDVTALTEGGGGIAELEGEMPIAAETAQRLACDSAIQHSFQVNGKPLFVRHAGAHGPALVVPATAGTRRRLQVPRMQPDATRRRAPHHVPT